MTFFNQSVEQITSNNMLIYTKAVCKQCKYFSTSTLPYCFLDLHVFCKTAYKTNWENLTLSFKDTKPGMIAFNFE